MNRSGGLRRKTPLGRTVPLERTGGLASVTPLRAYTTLQRGGPIRPVSDKRRAENRKRAAMADRLWPDRREGIVMCGCGRPECNRRADDGHEILTRARGGSITDETNVIPLARECHGEIQLGPDWAYAAGLLRHSGLCCHGRAVCSQYADAGDAA